MTGATFHKASPQDAGTILRLMQGCYAEDGCAFEALAARGAVEGLLAPPECGRAWCVEVAGEVVGYFVLNLGYSFRIPGRGRFPGRAVPLAGDS